MTAARLIALNACIRIAAAAAGQLFAFVLAERMSERAGAGALLVGLIAAGFFITELVGAPIAGRLADARGHVRVLRWGPIFGIAAMLTAAGGTWALASLPLLTAVLLSARMLEGASAACAVPTTLALLAVTSAGDAGRRLRVMAWFEVTSLLGLMAGFALAGIAWGALGAGAFLLLPLPYMVAEALTWPGKAEEGSSGRRTQPAWRSLAALMRRRTFFPFALAWLAVNAIVGVWLQQAPYLLKLPARSATQQLVGGFSAEAIGAIFAAWGLAFLSGIALWSWLAPAWPRRRILAIALGGMLLVVAALWWYNHGGPTLLLALAVAGVLLESGFAPAAFAHLADITDTQQGARGLVMGVYAVLLSGGQLAGATLGAPFVARWQMDGVLLVTTLLCVIAAAAVAGMGRTPMLSR